MRSEHILETRMRKAINKGFFSEIKAVEEANALVIHQEECLVSADDYEGDNSECNCIPDVTVSLMGKTFTIDEDGIVSNHIVN